MKLTKHAYARFKQRQKVKNAREMMRKYSLAIERGTLLVGESSQPQTLCCLFDGCKYIVTDDKKCLITVFRAKKASSANKKHLIEQLRMREYDTEARLCLNIL